MVRRRNYTFTNKKNSEKALMGSALGVISLLSMAAVIFLAYSKNGAAAEGYGFTGLFATIFSVSGLILGILALREKDRFHFFSWLSVILNAAVLLVIGFLLYIAVW